MEGKVTRGPRTRRRNRGQVKKTNGGEEEDVVPKRGRDLTATRSRSSPAT